jgi:hypothetical protein
MWFSRAPQLLLGQQLCPRQEKGNTGLMAEEMTRLGQFGERPLFLWGVAIICACGLALQIIEARILSVIAVYHLAFFAISMAMFGMTTGALIIHFKRNLLPDDRLAENLTWISAAFGASVVFSTLSLISSVVVTPGDVGPVMLVMLWAKVIMILAPPYIFLGMAVSLALTRSRWPIGLVYGVDLAGAATGCLVVLVLLNWIDAISAMIAVGALGSSAAICFAASRRASADRRPVLLAIARNRLLMRPSWAASLFAALAAMNAIAQPNGLGLTLVHGALETPDSVAAVQWNSFSRVMIESAATGQPQMWGASKSMPRSQIMQRWMNIDGDAGTVMYNFDGDLSKVAFLKYDITNLAYAIRSQGRAAIIGIGGGRDLLSAYVFGFRDVTGVELNPIFANWLSNRFHNFNRLTDLPGMRIFVDEARSWFARSQDRFDLIQMSLIDTWAATGAGAFTLSENGLYTVQGWGHFLAHLAPNGVFTASRWYDANNVNETGRLVSLAVATLRNRGISQPQDHIFLAANDFLATLVVSNEPYSARAVATLEGTAAQLGFSIIISPGSSSVPLVLRHILDAHTEQAIDELRRTYHLDLSAPTDARPFFFNQLRLTDPASMLEAMNAVTGVTKGNLVATMTLFLILALSAALCLVAIIIPALPALRETTSRLAWLGSAYFLLIGLGFMFIEIGIIQRISIFLGHPVYGLAIGLFGIIVSTGVGSLLFERTYVTHNLKIVVWAALIAIYVALLPVWLPTLVETFEGGALITRIFASLVAIAPSGILMGFGFPEGMSLVRTIDERPMPWFWAINGAAGVLAASAAILVSMEFSINASLWWGAFCYLLVGPVGLGLDQLAGKIRPPGASSLDAYY